MILKLVQTGAELEHHGGRFSEQEVDSPYTNWVFEVPHNGMARYRKITFKNWKIFRLHTEGWTDFSVIGKGPPCNCSISGDGCNTCESTLEYYKCPKCGQQFNNLEGNVRADRCERCHERKATKVSYELTQEGVWYIEILLLDETGAKDKMILAMQSSLYVMNDQGKTVDTIHAFNG